jgi:hypothetical protein
MLPRFVFRLTEGFHFHSRSVGFLEETEHSDLDARAVFINLKPKVAQLLRTRIDHWLQRNVYPKWFHRFSGKYGTCLVFKWEERHKPQRLYGFICHPRPKSEPKFECCVLCYYGQKDDATDYSILDRILRLVEDVRVREAIAVEYAEFQGTSSWTN